MCLVMGRGARRAPAAAGSAAPLRSRGLALSHHLLADKCARLRAAALCLKLWERRQGAALPPDVTCLLLRAALE